MSKLPAHPGSTYESTSATVPVLKKFFSDYGIQSVADIPCGSGDWITQTTEGLSQYIGLDIKEDSIKLRDDAKSNSNQYYRILNVVEEIPPKVDCIIFRDLAIHLSYFENMLALNNMIDSGSKYLLAGTFSTRENTDLSDNTFRRINLQAAPFNLPDAELILPDPHIVDGVPAPADHDRVLALWPISTLEKFSQDQIKAVSPTDPARANEFVARARRHYGKFGNRAQGAFLLSIAVASDPNVELSPEDLEIMERYKSSA